jgi:transcriptional regulator GlxA family with amidase domain
MVFGKKRSVRAIIGCQEVPMSHLRSVDAVIVAVPETAGSALYGMVDVLSAAGNIWQTLVRSTAASNPFRVRILSPDGQPFVCGNGIPVTPEASVADDPAPDIVIIPELWLGPDEDLKGRYPDLMNWIWRKHAEGAALYSACSGAVMLAETGLLDGCDATSHWGYQDLFRNSYPKVHFRPEPNLAFADPAGRIVTAGGTTSWHDLAIHIISRHCSPAEALRVAKVYLLKWHGEGQLPYEALVRRSPQADSVVRQCEDFLGDHFREEGVLPRAVQLANIPERTLKRRFRIATGSSLIERLQKLRIEEAKRMLENSATPVTDISFEIGYEDPSFFRRLFKRLTGVTPSQYRRMFQPVAKAASMPPGPPGVATARG